jgi:hypothetical protein
MKRVILLLLGCSIYGIGFTQHLAENEKTNSRGLECWYTITNTQDKEDHSRYEVTLYCSNRSEGIIFKAPVIQSGSYVKYENNIAVFNCINATGKRLTPKSGTVEMGYLTVPVADTYTDCKTNKTVSQVKYVRAGSILQPGETVSRRVIFLTAKGEKPDISLNVLL